MLFRTKKLIMAALFAVLTIIGGWIKIPMLPVPMTLQTFFVLLAGLVTGPFGGMASQCIYLILGLIGLPVFAYGGGLGYVLQPTFGYLAGFPLAAYVVGSISKQPGQAKQFIRTLFACVSGMVVISFCGILYLYFNLKYLAGNPLPFSKIYFSGFLAFLPTDLIKAVLAAIISKMLYTHPVTKNLF